MLCYIHQLKDWPRFHWELPKLVELLAGVHQKQGYLRGRMEALGFDLCAEATLRTLTLEVVKNSEIENELLDSDQVRSSIARRLGMNIAGLIPADRHVEGAVEILLDATRHFNEPLTKKRLFSWHAALFPPTTEFKKMHSILVANWRDDSQGPMQVVSGYYGHERVHFEAPKADRIEEEMKNFLTWFNKKQDIDPILKAGIAHLWFVTIHPFEDGNGRIARTITDLQLSRAEGHMQRFYSMSVQIQQERAKYYNILESTQKSSLDITSWLEWFLSCLNDALSITEQTLADLLDKARFWQRHNTAVFNERQRHMLNKLFDGFVGKLTSSKWAKITKCSQDTALRDIQDLIERDIFVKESAGGRSTSYFLKK